MIIETREAHYWRFFDQLTKRGVQPDTAAQVALSMLVELQQPDEPVQQPNKPATGGRIFPLPGRPS